MRSQGQESKEISERFYSFYFLIFLGGFNLEIIINLQVLSINGPNNSAASIDTDRKK